MSEKKEPKSTGAKVQGAFIGLVIAILMFGTLVTVFGTEMIIVPGAFLALILTGPMIMGITAVQTILDKIWPVRGRPTLTTS